MSCNRQFAHLATILASTASLVLGCAIEPVANTEEQTESIKQAQFARFDCRFRLARPDATSGPTRLYRKCEGYDPAWHVVSPPGWDGLPSYSSAPTGNTTPTGASGYLWNLDVFYVGTNRDMLQYADHDPGSPYMWNWGRPDGWTIYGTPAATTQLDSKTKLTVYTLAQMNGTSWHAIWRRRVNQGWEFVTWVDPDLTATRLGLTLLPEVRAGAAGSA